MSVNVSNLKRLFPMVLILFTILFYVSNLICFQSTYYLFLHYLFLFFQHWNIGSVQWLENCNWNVPFLDFSKELESLEQESCWRTGWESSQLTMLLSLCVFSVVHCAKIWFLLRLNQNLVWGVSIRFQEITISRISKDHS